MSSPSTIPLPSSSPGYVVPPPHCQRPSKLILRSSGSFGRRLRFPAPAAAAFQPRSVIAMAATAIRTLRQHVARATTSTSGRRAISTKLLDGDEPLVRLWEARRFIIDCMKAVGTPEGHAECLADVLVEADYRGHYSHGMNRLHIYIDDVKSGLCDCKATPDILRETPATAWIDGKNGLGAVIGHYCMELAIGKARTVGVGVVSCKASNHYGIAGMYALQAINKGFIGMSFTNTSPLMAPTRSKNAALGTNPLAFGAPASQGDRIILDMATTAVAVGKIELEIRKNKPIPDGWALGADGKPTTNAQEAYDAHRLMPLGGTEENSGYKGYGLGLMVEVLCGVLADGNYGPNVRRWGDHSKPANLGHCFIAIDPHCFAPKFEDRLGDLVDLLRKSEPVDPNNPVWVAGDPEILHMKAVDSAGGVRYVQNQLDNCKRLSEELKVRPLKFKDE